MSEDVISVIEERLARGIGSFQHGLDEQFYELLALGLTPQQACDVMTIRYATRFVPTRRELEEKV